MGVKGYPTGENWRRSKEGIYAPPASGIIRGWLAGWSYRIPVTLSRASGAVTNYQMKVIVGESYGSTTVNCSGLCATDFDDIRFTKSDGTTLLDYWIESISGATPNQLATIWIEFDFIDTGATTFYMYYGNAGAAAYSNGINTFIKFDDFEWGNDEDNVDTSGGGITWIKSVAGTSTAKIDTAQKYGGSKSLRLYRDATNNAVVYFEHTAADNEYAISYMLRKDTAVTHFCYAVDNGTDKYTQHYVTSAEDIYAGTTDTTVNAAFDTWEEYELRAINYSTTKFDLYHKGVRIALEAAMQTPWDASSRVWLSATTGTGTLWIDNVRIRNWRPTEPAWGAWGAQES
jgi:hypothetical protein